MLTELKQAEQTIEFIIELVKLKGIHRKTRLAGLQRYPLSSSEEV